MGAVGSRWARQGTAEGEQRLGGLDLCPGGMNGVAVLRIERSVIWKMLERDVDNLRDCSGGYDLRWSAI